MKPALRIWIAFLLTVVVLFGLIALDRMCAGNFPGGIAVPVIHWPPVACMEAGPHVEHTVIQRWSTP